MQVLIIRLLGNIRCEDGGSFFSLPCMKFVVVCVWEGYFKRIITEILKSFKIDVRCGCWEEWIKGRQIVLSYGLWVQWVMDIIFVGLSSQSF